MSTSRLDEVIRLGFDCSEIDARDGQSVLRVRCSQCQAATVNGIPCHEHGCPNQTRECEECEAPIKRGLRLCESCANPEPEDEADDEPTIFDVCQWCGSRHDPENPEECE